MSGRMPTHAPIPGVPFLWHPGKGVCHIDGGDGRPACGANDPRRPAVDFGSSRPYICKRCRDAWEPATAPEPREALGHAGCGEDGCTAAVSVLVRDSRCPGGWARLCARHWASWYPPAEDLGAVKPYERRRKRRAR